MLNIAFGQSKYFIDNLSENVKRGLGQKLRNGIYPGWAPLGYLNDYKNHNIVIHTEKHKLIKRIFELYSTGEYTLKNLADKFNGSGLTSHNGKKVSQGMMLFVLKNPFYYGVFKYKGELHEGKHEPIITKKLFDQAQEMLKQRGRHHEKKNHNYIFTDFMKCGACGCAITAEQHKGYIYYRCTKKKGSCAEKYVREELLTHQLKNIMQKVSLPDDWADNMLNELNKEKMASAQSSIALVNSLNQEVKAIKNKLDNLLDSHLEGVIDKNDYLRKKAELINKKVGLEEKIKRINDQGDNWLEPMRDFILRSRLAKKTADEGDLSQFKAFLKISARTLFCKAESLNF